MSTVEVATMDRMQKTGRPPQAILAKLQSARAKRGVNGPSQTAVYRFLNGSSYARGQEERRGRQASILDGLAHVAFIQRRRLIMAAKNEWLVTWKDVHKATRQALRAKSALAKAKRMPSVDWLARKVRAGYNVRSRPGKRRISQRDGARPATPPAGSTVGAVPQVMVAEEYPRVH